MCDKNVKEVGKETKMIIEGLTEPKNELFKVEPRCLLTRIAKLPFLHQKIYFALKETDSQKEN